MSSPGCCAPRGFINISRLLNLFFAEAFGGCCEQEEDDNDRNHDDKVKQNNNFSLDLAWGLQHGKRSQINFELAAICYGRDKAISMTYREPIEIR